MADIHSATADITDEEEKIEEEDRRTNDRMKI